MSVFKTKWIILKIKKVKDEFFLYTIFSYDYGIIKANKKEWKWRKKWKNLDIWYIINFEIETQNKDTFHKIRNAYILSEFHTADREFIEIYSYLSLVCLMLKKVPVWIPHYEIFEIVESIHKQEKINSIHLILAQIKIIDLLWNLNINHKDNTTQKILHFIHRNKIAQIFKLTGFTKNNTQALEEVISSCS